MDYVNTNLILDLGIKSGAKVAENFTLKVKTSVYNFIVVDSKNEL
jgi:hypothetical protein